MCMSDILIIYLKSIHKKVYPCSLILNGMEILDNLIYYFP